MKLLRAILRLRKRYQYCQFFTFGSRLPCMKKWLPFALFLLICISAQSQTAKPSYSIDRSRMLFHDNIDKEQIKLFTQPGSYIRGYLPLTKDEAINTQIQYAMIDKVDALQQQIELDSILSD